MQEITREVLVSRAGELMTEGKVDAAAVKPRDDEKK